MEFVYVRNFRAAVYMQRKELCLLGPATNTYGYKTTYITLHLGFKAPASKPKALGL